MEEHKVALVDKKEMLKREKKRKKEREMERGKKKRLRR